MTWLGKILAACAMVLALVWMWFTATVYVTRTNWKAQADQYKKGYEEARAAREGEWQVYLAERNALAKQVAAAGTRADGLAGQVATLVDESKKYTDQIAANNKVIKDTDVQKAVELQASNQSLLKEVDNTRARAVALEDEKVRLTVEKEDARKAQLAAEIAMKQEASARLLAESMVSDLRDQLADSRRPGGGGLRLGKAPEPVPPGLRGTVDAVGGGTLVLSVGFEAGLTPGAKLDVYRTGTDTRFLGTATVTRVEPKAAVATFTPADQRKTLAQLRAEELPRVNDTVGVVGGNR